MPAAHPPPDNFRPHRRADRPAPPPDAPAVAALDPAVGGLAALHRSTARLARRFAVTNAACFGIIVLSACTGSGLLATEVIGRINLGILLGLFQGVLLLWTAAHYDRRSTGQCDPVADGLRERRGERRAERYEQRYDDRHRSPYEQHRTDRQGARR
ncbi:DUF485 domain-containing protein [Kitasatospora paranensis]|uniref:DUF485 domain-containing protein n=1 Tax=Kitasatospora paranensis TaxID=258053 RepID=A0ABW2FTA3_9ACTN